MLETLTEILKYFTDQKLIIMGAAITVSELIIIAVNTYRRLRAKTEILMKFPALTKTPTVDEKKLLKENTLKVILWAANPINLFRKPTIK